MPEPKPVADVTQLAIVGSLYSHHQAWLLSWLRGKSASAEDAADLSHDTFERVLRARVAHVLKEPRAYLLVTANRLLINRYRRLKVEQEVLRQCALLLPDCESRGPLDILLATDLLAKVVSLLLEELPEKPRRAFVMARLHGMSYREIAAELQVSESSVKQYLSKALLHCHARVFDRQNND